MVSVILTVFRGWCRQIHSTDEKQDTMQSANPGKPNSSLPSFTDVQIKDSFTEVGTSRRQGGEQSG